MLVLVVLVLVVVPILVLVVPKLVLALVRVVSVSVSVLVWLWVLAPVLRSLVLVLVLVLVLGEGLAWPVARSGTLAPTPPTPTLARTHTPPATRMVPRCKLGRCRAFLHVLGERMCCRVPARRRVRAVPVL